MQIPPVAGAQPSYLAHSCRRRGDTIPWSDYGAWFGCRSVGERRLIVGSQCSNGSILSPKIGW